MRRLADKVSIDLLLTAIAAALVVPALHRANLPFSLNWAAITTAYLVLGFQSFLVAAVLWTIQSPGEVLGNLARRFWQDKPKLVLLAAFTAAMIIFLGVRVGILFTILSQAALEWIQRNRTTGERASRQLIALLPAAAYLFLGLLLLFAYNNIIVRLRFYGAYDAFLNQLDMRLFGTTVSAVAQRAAEVLPARCYSALSAIYYGMFPQIGAAVIICAFSSGPRRALRFVGTLLVTYYVALLLFYLWPSHGPYYLSADHFSRTAALTGTVDAFAMQRMLLANVQSLWAGSPVQQLPTAYYIAFPCMHIAKPLVVIWFLRRWKRMAIALAIYDLLLVASIILLEWHYFVDLLGGVAVAAIAVFLMEFPTKRNKSDQPPSQSDELAGGARTSGARTGVGG